MSPIKHHFLSYSLALILAGCGGGGAGMTNMGSTSEPGPAPTTPRSTDTEELTYLLSHTLRQSNIDFLNSWDASPQVDLPENGSYGLRVTRPREGGASVQSIAFQNDLAYHLEPILLFNNNDPDAWERLTTAELLVRKIANAAYKQWTRHLDYDPGVLRVVVGDGHPNHHSGSIAYYNHHTNSVVLTTGWVIQTYSQLRFGSIQAAIEELFFVFTHEAAHQFDYTNPRGTTDGCPPNDHCHAPYGSGSVAGYDHLQGRSVRYNVTEEDIRHIPNATWNDSTVDRYEVWKLGDAISIDSWGVWIDHEFEVSGQTDPGRLSGGDLNVVDSIEGTGWVVGIESNNVELSGDATWSGQDNFLGVDLDSNFLGSLLRADANLSYTFSTGNLNLRVNNFEAHYSTGGAPAWHDHNFPSWGDFSYDMSCVSDVCMGNNVEANWYANDAGDPAGYVGGVVDDDYNSYVGSFVAEKDL